MNLAGAKAEVDGASDKIAAVTGRRPVSFSYPMGRINGVALEAVSECPGLKIAVTKTSGVTESCTPACTHRESESIQTRTRTGSYRT